MRSARQRPTGEDLGVVPFSTAIGVHLSTRGHHYRPAAQALLEVVDGRA